MSDDATSREKVTRLLYSGPPLAGVGSSVIYVARAQGLDLKWGTRIGFEMRTQAGKRLCIFTNPRTNLWFERTSAAIHALGNDPSNSALTNQYKAHFEFLHVIDGVVFVADSQVERREANIESVDNLIVDLAEVGRGPEEVPLVFQCNKQDLSNARPAEQLKSELNWPRSVHIGASNRTGVGVVDALRALFAMLPDDPTRPDAPA